MNAPCARPVPICNSQRSFSALPWAPPGLTFPGKEIEQTFSRVYGSHCDAGIGLPKTSFRSSSTSFLGVSSFDPPLSDFLSAPLSAVLSEVLSEDLSEDLSEVLSL